MSKRLRAAHSLIRSTQYVLITPEEVILQGELSKDFSGLLQISALEQVKAHLENIISDWEKANGRNKTKRRKSSVNKPKKVRA